MIDFPASPTIGQTFTASGVTWTWDGTKWTAAGLNVAYLPLAGGTMTGPIVLSADPTASLNPVTLQYFNARPMLGDNRIINGDMRIDQRWNGASETGIATYTLDRWYYFSNQAGKFNWGRNTPGTALFPYFLFFTSTGAYTALAGDDFAIYQVIEADMITDFQWGTATAQPVTLSFWAYSSQGGTFGGSIRSGNAGRSYPFTFALPNSAWQKVVITIPGDTGGTWTLTGNGAGLMVGFDLGSGGNFLAAPGAWVTGNYSGATGAVSVVATNGASFFFTGVKLEIGSVATPFNRYSLAKCMADCQRYYEIGSNALWSGYGSANVAMFSAARFSVYKRAVPTITATMLTQNGFASGPTLDSNNIDVFQVHSTMGATAVSNAYFTYSWTASAEL